MALLLIYSQLIRNKRSCLKSQQPCQYCDLAQYDRVVYIYVSHFDKLNVTKQAQCDNQSILFFKYGFQYRLIHLYGIFLF